MSPSITDNNELFYLTDESMMPFLHPLDTTPTPDKKTQENNKDWNNLISNLQLEPDMLQLIELCKLQEEKRRQEETKMKLKEYQVLCQLNFLQQTTKDFNLQLPKSSK